MVVVLVVSIVRKVAQSERDCSLTKKKERKKTVTRNAPTKNTRQLTNSYGLITKELNCSQLLFSQVVVRITRRIFVCRTILSAFLGALQRFWKTFFCFSEHWIF